MQLNKNINFSLTSAFFELMYILRDPSVSFYNINGYCTCHRLIHYTLRESRTKNN